MLTFPRNLSINTYKNIFVLICSFILSAFLLVITGYLLNHFIHLSAIPYNELIQQYSPDLGPHEFGPQNMQHFLFAALTLLYPIYCFVSLYVIEKIWDNLKEKYFTNSIRTFTNYLLIFACILFWTLLLFVCFLQLKTPFFNASFQASAKMQHLFALLHPYHYLIIFSTILCVSLLLMVCLKLIKWWCYKYPSLPSATNKQWKTVLLIFICSVAILVHEFPGRVLTFNFFTYHHPSIIDMDATFYSFVQVIYGKTLLANIPALYGLFAEVLAPIFKIIGLSTFKLSLVMCILSLITTSALSLITYLLTKSRIITILFTFFICLFGGGIFSYYSASGGAFNLSPYYQYFPVRIIFPVISVLAFWWLAQSLSNKKIIIFSLLTSVALIWNLESGIPILGSILLYLFAKYLFSQSREFKICISKNFLLFFGILIGALALFAVYLETKSGFSVQWTNIFKYHLLYSQLGIAQIPIPQKDYAWCIILTIYASGILYALYDWHKQNPNQNDKSTSLTACIFYISILGIGLFTYYIYRSHIFNLLAVSWPAILLWSVFTNQIFTQIKQFKLPTISTLFVLPLVFICLISSVAYIGLFPSMYKRAINLIQTITAPNPNSRLTKDIVFIKNELHGNNKAVILLYGQSMFSAELGIMSEIDNPSEIEIVTKTDYYNVLDQLMTRKVNHIFIDSKDKKLPYLLKKYQIFNTSSTGTIHLIPKLGGYKVSFQ